MRSIFGMPSDDLAASGRYLKRKRASAIKVEKERLEIWRAE